MILVAENLTATSPAVARALAGRDPEPIAGIARVAAEAGVSWLDVNLGPRGRRSRADLSFVLDVLKDDWPGGILVDTTSPELMELAAKTWPGPVVLNGYADDPEREGALRVAADRGLDLVVLVMGSVPPASLEERLVLCTTLLERCRRAGIGPERIIVDPLVSPLGWADGQARNAGFFQFLRTLPQILGEPVRTLAGLSNLLTRSAGGSRPGRVAQVFLAMAAGAGLTHVMLDVKDQGLLGTVKAIAVLEGERTYAAGEFT